jgi:prevent-host-death family protein
MTQVTLEEAQDRLPELVAAAERGEEVVITRENQPTIKLVPVVANRQPGSAKGLIWMADDFDAPLEDFKEYVE